MGDMPPPTPENGLFGLLYTSASRGLEAGDLDALLRTARRRNEALGVTGVLVALRGEPGPHGEPEERFAQWLEGPEEAVRTVFGSILGDERHTSVIVMWQGPRTRRLCSAWSMALRHRSMASMVAALDELGLVLDNHLEPGASPEEVDDLILRAVLQEAA